MLTEGDLSCHVTAAVVSLEAQFFVLSPLLSMLGDSSNLKCVFVSSIWEVHSSP